MPEVIAARHAGLRVAAVSAITNLAEGMGDEELSHDQTLRVAKRGRRAPRTADRALPGGPVSFIPQELIRRKRDGGELSDEELAFLVAGIADGGLSDGQVAAFAMAVFFRDLSDAERRRADRRDARSGTVLEWDLTGPSLDKHSTGGVGDKVSLILAPIARGVRRRGADDLRPRPGPHRRHARQARLDPGLPTRRPTSPLLRSVVRRRRLRDHRPDRPSWRRPTGASTRCATRPPRSSRSR